MNRTWTAAVILIAAGAFAAGGCGTERTDGGGAEQEQIEPDNAEDLGTADTPLGEVVVDGDEMTVYVFDEDTPNADRSACTGSCLDAWPPVTTDSREPSVSGVTGTVDTIRTGGERHLTLNGLPLYTYAGDEEPGDVTGQAVEDVWWVVAPDGAKITKAPSEQQDDPGGY